MPLAAFEPVTIPLSIPRKNFQWLYEGLEIRLLDQPDIGIQHSIRAADTTWFSCLDGITNYVVKK